LIRVDSPRPVIAARGGVEPVRRVRRRRTLRPAVHRKEQPVTSRPLVRAAAVALALASCKTAPPATVAGDVCAADARRLCGAVPEGEGRVLECLRGHAADLSEACRLTVAPPASARAGVEAACAQEAARLCPGAPTAAEEMLACLGKVSWAGLDPACQDALWAGREKMDQFKAVCGGDAERLCKGVAPGEGRIVACLQGHQGDVSPVCRKLVAP
jgi:hypothetical protein